MVQMNFGGQPSPFSVYQPPLSPAEHADPYGAPPHKFAPKSTDPVEHPRPVHFYHLFAGAPHWQAVATEHFQALRAAEFWGEVHVGLLGSVTQRLGAAAWLTEQWRGWQLAGQALQGYEQETLCPMHEYVQDLPCNTPVLYAHAKGSWRRSEHQDPWRRCMQDYCITRWRDCVRHLDEGYDTAGVHYALPDGKIVGIPMYCGNYWWGTAGYLAGLPAVRFRDRWDAEGWVGLGDPKAFDFGTPSWPNHPHD
jgi:hypothetical protein